MRPICLVLTLLLGTNLLYAQDAKSPSAGAGLCPEEIKEGFVGLFNGKTLDGWQGATRAYAVKNGTLVYTSNSGNKSKGGDDLFTTKEYSDFVLRFEFKLSPGANNGLAIRTPVKGEKGFDDIEDKRLIGDAAFVGMELQILDNSSPRWAKLKPYQFHGSLYGVAPAKRGHLKPVGQWNSQEVICKGRHITVILNGATILDVDIDEVDKPGIHRGLPHPGLKRNRGHIGFLGCGFPVEFRNIRIKEL